MPWRTEVDPEGYKAAVREFEERHAEGYLENAVLRRGVG